MSLKVQPHNSYNVITAATHSASHFPHNCTARSGDIQPPPIRKHDYMHCFEFSRLATALLEARNLQG